MIFSNLKAGSNLMIPKERVVAGTDGVGSSITNIYSSKFIISTCDGKNKFFKLSQNNIEIELLPNNTIN
jgi:DNA gyrase/topoisomerase IV subunit B